MDQLKQSNGDDEPGFDLGRYIHTVWKHKWVVLATSLALTIAAALYTLQLPKRYTAVSRFVIDPSPPSYLGSGVQEVIQLGSGTFWANQEYYNTQLEILRSNELSEMVVVRHKLATNPSLVGPAVAKDADEQVLVERAAGALRASLEFERPRGTRIVSAKVTLGDPKTAALIANAVVDTYIEYQRNRRVDGTKKASRWLSDELDAAEHKLHDAESKLHQYRKEHNTLSLLVSVKDQKNIVTKNLNLFEEKQATARAKRIELGVLRDRIREARKVDLLTSPIFALAESDAGGLKNELHVQKRKLIELSKTYGPKFPEYAAQQKKVEALRAELEAEADTIVGSIEGRYAVALGTEKGFQGQIREYTAEAHQLGPLAVEYGELARTRDDAAETYRTLVSRRRDSDLVGRLETVNVRALDAARAPGAPSYPRVFMNIAFAGVLALFAGLGLAFLLELLDRTIRSAADVEQAFGAPLLGVIPKVAADDNRTDEERVLAVYKEPASQLSECCRTIRTNLLFRYTDKPLKRLVVTSPNPREGKTTTSMYLGTTMAQNGQRVLLVDTDMRRPRLHKALGIKANVGLSSVLLGDVSLDDAIKTTEIPGLFLLPCGPIPPTPAELLMTDKFGSILDEIDSKFDRVILDSPPLLAVTDAAVLTQRTDGVIVVARSSQTLRHHGESAAQMLNDVNANIAGVILNGLDTSDRRYGYSYTYSYGYGPTEPDAAAS